MDNSNSQRTIQIKAFPRLVGLFFFSSVGVFVICALIFLEAIQFDSKYSLLGIVGGFAGMVCGLYVFLHSSPGVFKNGRVIFEIIPGSEGRIQSPKKSVALKDIKDISIKRRGISLRSIFYEDLVIQTHQNKIVQMKTYNLVNDYEFNKQINEYILPYMTSDAQAAYKTKLSQFPGNHANL